MKNNITTYMILSAMILVGLPACCGSKKNKNTKANEVTLKNNVDVISIEQIGENSDAQAQEDVAVETPADNINKF